MYFIHAWELLLLSALLSSFHCKRKKSVTSPFSFPDYHFYGSTGNSFWLCLSPEKIANLHGEIWQDVQCSMIRRVDVLGILILYIKKLNDLGMIAVRVEHFDTWKNYVTKNSIHLVLGSCGFHLCGFHLCKISKNSNYIWLLLNFTICRYLAHARSAWPKYWTVWYINTWISVMRIWLMHIFPSIKNAWAKDPV